MLISARDEKLFERYYDWTEIRRLRFDDALHKLSVDEFFLSEGRILQILRRMLRLGYTVDGKSISRPVFTGFRLKCPVPASPSAPRYVEGKLFECP